MEGEEAKRLKGKKINRWEAETKLNLDGQFVDTYQSTNHPISWM